MRKTIASAAAALLLALAVPLPATAQTVSLEKCQALKDRIDNYSRLRRKGGSASQMDGWKRRLRRAEAQFREYECRDYGRELQ